MANGTRRHFLSAGTAALASGFSLPNLSAAIQNTTSPYRRPKLKITDVRTAQVLVHGPQVHVRVYTDQGIYGHGEATDAAVGAVPLIQGFKRALIGRDPLNVDYLFESLRTSGIFAGAQAGQYVTALSGVEIALWDLAGKALGLPIYQLLGGKMRERIRIYCDMAEPNMEDPHAPEEFQQVKALGFTAVKTDVDEPDSPLRWDKVNRTASNAEIDRMVKRVAFAREAFEKRVDLAVDMHGQYDDDRQARGHGA